MTLAGACQRALVAAARAQHTGTRQQLRAAARRFVRRHRRDAAYLRWVLHGVAASSALAVALLGLGAEPARADFTPFVVGSLSGLTNVGAAAAPALGDLDADGDPDLVSDVEPGAFAYFENAIVKPAPKAFELVGGANPLAGKVVDEFATPALGDLDADGDLDLVAGDGDAFVYFENTRSALSPAFVRRTGAANPLDGQIVGNGNNAPALGDLDGDGDLDLVSGDDYGLFLYYENTGSATGPAFLARTGTANPLDGLDVGNEERSHSTPALGDLDGDGDLDLVSGQQYGRFFYFENTGNATSPAFVARTGAANPMAGKVVGSYSAPALGDLDGDGDLDLVSGEYYGQLFYFRNTGSATNPLFVARTGTANPFDGLDVGGLEDFDYSTPALGDLDGDGDLDVVAGEYLGTFHTYYMPEPGHGVLLGAGLALLGFFERLRARRR